MEVTTGSNFKVKDLGVQTEWVYDIEVENNHNFFANDILVHNSNYITLDEVMQKTVPDMDFLEFATIMDKQVLEPFYEKVLQIMADNNGMEQVIGYKREGVITKQFVLAKKKYLTELLADEDRVYDPPKIKPKGVEIVRSDTPKFNQIKIMEVVKEIFSDPDKQRILDFIRDKKKEFKVASIEDISSVRGVKDYNKYAENTNYYIKNGLNYKSATPIHVRASMCYNYMIKKHNLPYIEVSSGSKIKYIFVKENNVLNTNVIAYVGNFPSEFHEHFKIDYDMQFEKTFMGVIQRMFEVLGWGEIDLRGNALAGFLKKKKK